MTSYDPNPTVYINGSPISDDVVLNDLSVTMGRTNILEQPSPGYARASLWTTGDSALDINLSDPFQIKMESSLYGDPVRTNLIVNPSFETNVLFTQITSPAGATLARTTTQAYVGLSSCVGTTGATAGNIIFGTNAGASRISVVGGTTYIASFALKSATVSRTAYIRILFYDSASTLLSTTNGTNEATSLTEWQVRSVSATAPALAVTTIVQVVILNAGTSETHYLDALMLETGSILLPYFDGSSTSPLGAAWTGTPNASTSTLTGVLVSVFNGIISDIEIELPAYGDKGSVATYTVTAVGPLASLQKKTAGSINYPKELEGDRILRIMTEAFLTEWDDLDPTITWDDLPTGATWQSYDGINITIVDDLSADIDAGIYEIMAYTDGETNALTLAQNAAQSGRGVLSEESDGSVHYNDYNARIAFTSLELNDNDLASAGLKTAAQWAEIVNDVNVTYRAGSVNSRDEQSIILYGQLTGTRDTQLHNLVDAETQADQFKEARSFPRVYPEQFVIPLHSDTINDTTRDSLIDVYCGLPIRTNDLPAVFGTTFEGYVEGWNWRIRQKEAALTLIASAQSETYPSIVWYQLAPGTTWSAYPALVKWMDL